ncbi:hypothetical protein ACXYL9_13245 [Qipengyuania sp. CAU 1752]
MINAAIVLSLMVQQATSPSDLPPAPPVASESVPSDLKRIFVADSSEALRVEIEHPLQQICIRKPVLGSRVKAQTVCQDQTSWKAYQLARDADADEWANVAKGIVIE